MKTSWWSNSSRITSIEACGVALRYATRLTSLGVLSDARLAQHLHLDLTGILHRFFDALGDLAGEARRADVVYIFWAHDHAHLAPGLQGVALLNAF